MRTTIVRTAATAGLLAPLLVAALHGRADAATAPADPCQSARQALEAGDYRDASKLYSDDTRQPLTKACGQAGLTATDALSAAGQLLSAGLTAQAGTEIVRALDAVPLLTLPADLVPQGTAEQDEAVAKTLDADGFHDQAVALLQRAISGDPSFSASLDTDAKNILGLIPQPLYLRVWSIIWQFVASPAAIVCWLVVLAVVLLANLPKLIRRLYLQQFTAADGISSGDSLAKTLRSQTREELARMARESARTPGGRGLRLHLAGPYDDQNKDYLEQIVNQMSSRAQVFYRVITLLTRRIGARSSVVTGSLASETEVELDLKSVTGKPQGDKVIKHDELGFPDEGDFQPGPQPPDHQGRMQQLALATAAWIILTRYRRRKVTLGGTMRWESYVAFAAGCTWEAAGSSQEHRDHARARYERARKDTTAAVINLAAMDLAEDLRSEPKPQGSIDSRPWYRALNAIVKAPEQRRFFLFRRPRDLEWYRARYLLAMGLRDFMEAVPQAGDARIRFEREARELTAEVAIELEKRAGSPGWLPKDVVDYWRSAAITLLARQVMTRTTDPSEVSTTNTSPGFTRRDIGTALLRIRNGPADKGTTGKLLDFVKDAGLKEDDQAKYHLARLSRSRYTACVKAIKSWDKTLRENPEEPNSPNRSKWRTEVKNYMNQLWEDAEEERAEAKGFQREVRNAGDPFLAPEIALLEEQEPLDPKSPGDGDTNWEWKYSIEGREERRVRPLDRPKPTPPPDVPLPPAPSPDTPPEHLATPPEQESRLVSRQDGLDQFNGPVPPTGDGLGGEGPAPASTAPTRPDLPTPASYPPARNAVQRMVSPDEEASPRLPRSPGPERPVRLSQPVIPPRPGLWTRMLRSVGLARRSRQP